MRNEIPEGYELVAGHSAKNARHALDLADERGLGVETVIRSRSGYLVPIESVPEVTFPPANIEEAEERAAAAREEVETVDAEGLDIPKANASNEVIDAFAAEWDVSYDGIEAADAEKPTRAEKVAHITKTLEALATENSKSEE
jgi:hypothetical protein